MYLSKSDFLSRYPRRETDHTLPDGAVLRIRELSLRDRIDAEKAGQPDPETGFYANRAAFYATAVQRGVLNGPGGDLLFTPDDLSALQDIPGEGRALEQLWAAVWQFSEADQATFRRAGTDVDATGNSNPDDRGTDAGGEA